MFKDEMQNDVKNRMKTLEEIFAKKNNELTVEDIKFLGVIKSSENLLYLIKLYESGSFKIDVRREILSSIGRQTDEETIYDFIEKHVFQTKVIELVYQMYRTCLYRGNNTKFYNLGRRIYDHFDNEVIKKMTEYHEYRAKRGVLRRVARQFSSPTLLAGDNTKTLSKVADGSVQLIFTSPPYYNARVYSNYRSYAEYLEAMYQTLVECHRILEDGRFIIINVSPVISKRPGREFESIRYPIHYDFHNILTKAGFYFVDEIIWIKPECSVKNRNGGYQQTQMPLSYKPNCITESVMVYRKSAPFLLDKNIHKYGKSFANDDDKFDTSNCWYISPKADKNHPAVFPMELCEKVLKYYSFRNDVVLDPFAGSGTFGRAAIKMGRIPVMCELNEKYCDYIRRDGYVEF